MLLNHLPIKPYEDNTYYNIFIHMARTSLGCQLQLESTKYWPRHVLISKTTLGLLQNCNAEMFRGALWFLHNLEEAEDEEASTGSPHPPLPPCCSASAPPLGGAGFAPAPSELVVHFFF